MMPSPSFCWALVPSISCKATMQVKEQVHVNFIWSFKKCAQKKRELVQFHFKHIWQNQQRLVNGDGRMAAATICVRVWPDNKCGSSSRPHFGSPPSTSPGGSLRFCHHPAPRLCWTEFRNIFPGWRKKTTITKKSRWGDKQAEGR